MTEKNRELARMRKTLGVNIRHLREQQGLSQTDLATAAKIHRIYLWEIERGHSNVTLGILVRIAAVLNTSVSSLLR